MKKCFYIFIVFFLTFSFHPVASHGMEQKEESLKNVIFLIGDGMGMGQIEIARLFEYGKEGRLFLETLPHTALVHTYSANNHVTDSAAGGTALATGMKTNNGMIGVTPDGKEVDSILDMFKKKNKKTAIITTNAVTDATPASFTASVTNRWTGQKEIAKQQLANKVDIILGGGKQYFSTSSKGNRSLIDSFKKNGYHYVTTKDELHQISEGKLLGLFNEEHLTFMLDRDNVQTKEPTLKEMTKKALSLLSQDNEGFFAMIEGGRIDHASHSSDFTSIWKETVAFDQTVRECVNWAKNRKDTLVIVAADHETMGVSATEPMAIDSLKKISVTPHFMASQLKKKKNGKGFTHSSIKHVFKKYANISLSKKEIEQFQTAVQPKKGQIYRDEHIAWNIGNIIAKHYNGGILDRKIEQLSPTTGGHTSNMIAIFAYGRGASSFHGVLDNTDIPKTLEKLMK